MSKIERVLQRRYNHISKGIVKAFLQEKDWLADALTSHHNEIEIIAAKMHIKLKEVK